VMRQSLASIGAIAVWLSLLWFPPYWDEVHTGCAIPLAVLLLTSAVAYLLTRGFSFVTGLLLGLGCLARFDAAMFAGIVLVASLPARFTAKAPMWLAFLVAISPWVLYSEKHYWTVWASDNSAVATSATQAYVADYRLPTQTIATHPARWTQRVAVNS